MTNDLFSNLPTGALTPKQRKALYATVPRRKGHFATPGMGPAGETCGSCAYYRSVEYHNKTYPKCGRTKAVWTYGAGSDIRKKDAACSGWEGK